MISEPTFVGATIAGLVAFFTPCILPMVPFYLSYLAGVSMAELTGEGKINPGAQRRLLLSAVLFALGVTTIFGLMGLGATAVGQTFAEWKDALTYVAAAVIFVFGLHFLHVIQIPFLMREARMQSKLDPSTVVGAYVMGLAFGFGWSACVGPVLTTILMMAAMQDSLAHGAGLLITFGLGMTLPFVVAAAFAKPFLALMAKHRRHMGKVEAVMGVMLIVFAALLVSGQLNKIAFWMLETFPVFSTVG